MLVSSSSTSSTTTSTSSIISFFVIVISIFVTIAISSSISTSSTTSSTSTTSTSSTNWLKGCAISTVTFDGTTYFIWCTSCYVFKSSTWWLPFRIIFTGTRNYIGIKILAHTWMDHCSGCCVIAIARENVKRAPAWTGLG